MKKDDPSTWESIETDSESCQKIELLQNLAELLLEHSDDYQVRLNPESLEMKILYEDTSWGEVSVVLVNSALESSLVYQVCGNDIENTFDYADDALSFIVDNCD